MTPLNEQNKHLAAPHGGEHHKPVMSGRKAATNQCRTCASPCCEDELGGAASPPVQTAGGLRPSTQGNKLANNCGFTCGWSDLLEISRKLLDGGTGSSEAHPQGGKGSQHLGRVLGPRI